MNFIRLILTGLAAERDTLWATFKGDLIRITLLIGLGLLLLGTDEPTIRLVQYCFGISVLLVAASHILRKILFRSIDLAVLARSALQDMNLAAAVIFLSVSLTLIALMFIMALPVMTR